VRFGYEWHDDSGNWFRSYGNENWEFDENGLMRLRLASINDLPIKETERKYHWALGRRLDDHPGLSDLGFRLKSVHVQSTMMKRCSWVSTDNPLMLQYHDREWGVPVHDDRKHFEFLVLEAAQAGLSWSIVLEKREEGIAVPLASSILRRWRDIPRTESRSLH
jgi:hypothetical protein